MNRGSGAFQGLLIMIAQLAELLGIHPQLAGHLHMGVREVESPTRLDPIE
jgi:hypothetical protein